ncbi:hypothetical protein [Moorena producens]|nr:hypothetical protein [Moorena producens]
MGKWEFTRVWGDGEIGRWGDGEMGRWGDGVYHTYEVDASFLPRIGSRVE